MLRTLCLLALFFQLHGISSIAQSFKIVQRNDTSSCLVTQAFFEFELEASALYKGKLIPAFGPYQLRSSCLNISCKSSLVFGFTAECKTGSCVVYLVDSISNMIVDSTILVIAEYPFRLHLFKETASQDVFLYESLNSIMGLYAISTWMCGEPVVQELTVASYSLELQRNDTVVASIDIKGNVRVPDNFKDRLHKLRKIGDKLVVKDVYLTNNRSKNWYISEKVMFVVTK